MQNENLVIKPKKIKGEDGYKVFSIRVKEEIVAQIDNISTRTGHSRNELIGTFLEYALEKCVVEGYTC
ncbi:MAG: ribbon-helix-helix domain-containing protein [Lachnospiraceae bacterium]|nr:ribbon-helix-helix domain-containing protein [Lachnospiraceae bacterium]MDE7272358.1 ribbon-helix-helix domain-containing protein [Lachnospiraceae bacterium]